MLVFSYGPYQKPLLTVLKYGVRKVLLFLMAIHMIVVRKYKEEVEKVRG